MAKQRQRQRGQRQPLGVNPFETPVETLHSFSYETDWNIVDAGDVLIPDLAGQPAIPLSILRGAHSTLQAIVVWLRDQELSFSAIAQLLSRSESTVRNTYRVALTLGKLPADDPSGIRIPAGYFGQFDVLSPLEAVVHFLATRGLRNIDIAEQLDLDPRTTWTVKQRIKQKGVVLE